MNEQKKPLWTEEDVRRFSGRLTQLLSELIAKEFPEGLSEAQFKRLRKKLLASLEEETVVESRRVMRHFVEEESKRQRRAKRKLLRKEMFEESVERLTLNQRIQHMVMFTCTILLIITGLPIKFHEAHLADAIIQLLGGPNVTRILHRIGAVGLTVVGLYHLFYCMFFEEGRRNFGLLMPKLQDAKDIVQQIGYFLGRNKERPLFGRFSYIEKFDYWAVYWGMVVMIFSGYILWFMQQTINHLGKVSYDIAREAHSDEGLLATLAIIIWHFYNVHFNPKKFPGSLTWWHGRIPLEEFQEEHPLEYEEWIQAQREEEEVRTESKPSHANAPASELHPGPKGGEIS
jgi:cytochrome b subunit of formate dehydrogenase